jgi:type IV pilus assembly protein PilP
MSARPSRSPSRGLAALGLAAAAALLAGCEADRAELQAWMDETRRNTPTITEKISEPKKFEPFVYQAADETDPFSAAKMRVAGATVAGRASNGLQPDTARRREPLEAYPLDNLKMVGNLRRGSTTVALLQADTAVFQVRVGNYVGQNFGRVLRISEDEVAIRETVQDAAGDWVERDTALQLQVQETRK